MKIDQTVMQFRLELANDKKWSYTDCSILVMAHRLQIFKVFAFDDHIRQMAGLGIVSVPPRETEKTGFFEKPVFCIILIFVTAPLKNWGLLG